MAESPHYFTTLCYLFVKSIFIRRDPVSIHVQWPVHQGSCGILVELHCLISKDSISMFCSFVFYIQSIFHWHIWKHSFHADFYEEHFNLWFEHHQRRYLYLICFLLLQIYQIYQFLIIFLFEIYQFLLVFLFNSICFKVQINLSDKNDSNWSIAFDCFYHFFILFSNIPFLMQ